MKNKKENIEDIEKNKKNEEKMGNKKENNEDIEEKKNEEKMGKEIKKKDIEDINEYGNTKFLNSIWTVWIHKSDCTSWTEESYTNIYAINNVGSFWRFYNNFHLLDKNKYQYFVMRNKIKPIWEDNENRNGTICSFKVDYGICAFTCISLLIMNETFIKNNEEINGISYTTKNKSALLKIWFKNIFNKITGKESIEFLNKFNITARNNKFGNKNVSIRYAQIKPEYTN